MKLNKLEYYETSLNKFIEFEKEVFIEEYKEKIDLRKLRKEKEDQNYIYYRFLADSLNMPREIKFFWIGFTFRRSKQQITK